MTNKYQLWPECHLSSITPCLCIHWKATLPLEALATHQTILSDTPNLHVHLPTFVKPNTITQVSKQKSQSWAPTLHTWPPKSFATTTSSLPQCDPLLTHLGPHCNHILDVSNLNPSPDFPTCMLVALLMPPSVICETPQTLKMVRTKLLIISVNTNLLI